MGRAGCFFTMAPFHVIATWHGFLAMTRWGKPPATPPTEVFRPYFEGYFIPMALTTIGFNGAEWLNCPGMTSGTREQREEFIRKITDLL